MELYRVSEAAKMLDVHPNTIRKWVKARILRPVRLPGSQYSRFTAQEITRLRREMGFPGDDVARLYRVGEVAKMFGVHPNTVRKWVREDILHAIKLPESNYNRFAPQELNRLRRQMGLPPQSLSPSVTTTTYRVFGVSGSMGLSRTCCTSFSHSAKNRILLPCSEEPGLSTINWIGEDGSTLPPRSGNVS